MNSNLSLTDDPWQSTLRLFQEQILLLELASTTPQLSEFRSFRDAERRLLAGMLPTIHINPVAKSSRIDTELLSHLSDRTRGLNSQPDGFGPKLR
jgi:hypothetical protein